MAEPLNFCMGTAQLGSPYGIANLTSQPTRAYALELLDHAWKNDVRYFDTAHAYGTSESVLGDFLKPLSDQDHARIITKLPPDFSHGSENLIEFLMNSLRRMSIPSCWGIMLHRMTGLDDLRRLKKPIERAKDQGLIRHFGVSVYYPEEALALIKSGIIDCLQIPLNVLDKRWENCGVIDTALEKGIKLFARSIYLQGLFFLDESQVRSSDMGWAWPWLKVFRTWVVERGLQISEAAFLLVQRRYPTVLPVVGVESIEQLSENIALCKSQALTPTQSNEWWEQQHDVPEKLLNPSLWRKK